ncbi:MAG TPA: LOG family protein [Candidatus Saccharimonadales bacterium]|nr:LOG family protein [Candidatus Saccharimonadales bacterium]
MAELPPKRPILPLTTENINHVRERLKEGSPPGGRNIAVFAAAVAPFSLVHSVVAQDIGERIARRHNIVWGGSWGGLMGEVSSAAQRRGAFTVGVAYWAGQKEGYHSADFMFDAKDLTQRKLGFIALSDVALSLPGGLGTLDEVMTYMEHKKAGKQLPPLVFMNTNGFYDGLRKQIERVESEGLSRFPAGQLARFPETPGEAVMLLETL